MPSVSLPVPLWTCEERVAISRALAATMACSLIWFSSILVSCSPQPQTTNNRTTITQR